MASSTSSANARSVVRGPAGELVGTALLLAIVVGSGISGERLAQGNVALALLANAVATGTGLAVLILAFGPVSGAHFNPVVSLAELANGRLGWGKAAAYVVAQIVGAFAGVALAHGMFDVPLFSQSGHARAGVGQALGEGVATFGLLLTIFAVARWRPPALPLAVGGYITAAYWFTSSSSFANPAVTLARAATDTFTGIRPTDVPAFVGAQLAGAAIAVAFFRWISAETQAADPVRRIGDARTSLGIYHSPGGSSG